MKKFFLIAVLLLIPEAGFTFEGVLDSSRSKGIEGLSWESTQLKIRVRDVNSKDRVMSMLVGTFDRPGWALVISNRVIKPDANGRFEIGLPTPQPRSVFPVYAISDFGKTEKGVIQIEIAPTDMALIKSSSRWLISVGIGVTTETYKQSDTDDLNQLTTTLKFSAAHDISQNQRWYGTFSGRFDLFPVSDNQNSGVHFFDLNGRIDYSIPSIGDPWKLNIALGYYFVSSLGNFGFSNVSGPQLFPSFRYYFKNERFLSGYARYSPVLSNGTPLPFDNREAAIGIGFGIPIRDKHALSVNLDFSSLKLVLDSDTHSDLQTLTLGFSYTL